MRVPDYTSSSAPTQGTDMIPEDLGPEEALGLKGSNRDAGRWRGEAPSQTNLLMAAAIMNKLAMNYQGMRPSTNIEDDRSGDFAKAVSPILQQQQQQRLQDAKDRIRRKK